jgi:hypothetical protein
MNLRKIAIVVAVTTFLLVLATITAIVAFVVRSKAYAYLPCNDALCDTQFNNTIKASSSLFILAFLLGFLAAIGAICVRDLRSK